MGAGECYKGESEEFKNMEEGAQKPSHPDSVACQTEHFPRLPLVKCEAF